MKRTWIHLMALVASVVTTAMTPANPVTARVEAPVAQAGDAVGATQHVQAGAVPAGVGATDWASIQSQIASGPYRTYATKNGYTSANLAHGWQVQYGADGATLLTPRDPKVASWRWSLALTGYGYADLIPVSRPQAVLGQGQHLTYQWDDTLREWWKNDATGLEQGFTLRDRPNGQSASQPLRLRMAITGDLRAVQRGNTIAFLDPGGATAFTYDALRAWDATGRDVPARMVLGRGELILEVDDATAIYPLTIDPLLQQAYLKASNAEANDVFGYSVAVSGDTLVVGAYQESSNATGVNGNQSNNSSSASGAAYVFVRNGSAWSQQAYLKASNPDANDFFGQSVAISGDTVVVGAYNEDSNATGVGGNGNNNATTNSGAAYVFFRSGSTWSQQAYLKASNTGFNDAFGFSVAVSGDVVVVGASVEDSSATGVNGSDNNLATDSGAAYVFARTGSTWSQQAYLKSSNSEAGDDFGISVTASGNTVVVGADGEDSNATGVNGTQSNNSSSASGAAYVFVRSGSTWSQQAYLKASNTGAADTFGSSVAVSGDTVVVAALAEDSNATGVDGTQTNNSATDSGAAYVFVRSGTTWSQQAYLKASNTESNDGFGVSVAVAGDIAVVGANREDSNATGVNGTQSDNSKSASGAAYVFNRSGSTWSQQSYLKASNTDGNDFFGNSVSVSGDTVVVGAHGESSNATGVNGDGSNNSTIQSGATYVFVTGLSVVTATTGTGTGTIALNPSASSYVTGTVITVTATATAGSYFAGWSGNLSGSVNPITLTVNADKSITATFSLNIAPVADAGADQNVTVGTNVTLNGTGSSDPDGHTPLSYQWTRTGGPAVTLSSATAASPSFTAPATPTVLTFTLTVTDAQGLADATPDQVVITVTDSAITGLAAQNSSPTRLTNATSFTATITAGSNVAYIWNYGDGSSTSTGATQSHTYATTGNYTAILTATNATGSVSTTTLVTVTNSAPVANAGADQSVIVGANVTLNGSGSNDPDAHTPLSYRWTQTGGSVVTLSSNTAVQPTFTAPVAPAVLTFSLVVTDAQGLADATPDVVVITVTDSALTGLVAQNSSPTRLTNATSFTATITAGSNVAYTWNYGDGSSTSTGATQSHTYAAAGNYTAIVTATNGSGSVSTTTPVTVTNSAPVANAGADQNVNIAANVTLTGTGSNDPDNHTPLSYRWTQTGGTAVTLSSNTDAQPSFTAPVIPAVLTFSLVVTDAQGLADATPDVVVITVNDIAVAGLGADNDSPTRLTDATSFTATITAGSNVVYTWNFGDGSSTSTGVTQSHTYAAAGNYTAIVTATNGSGSVSTTTPVTVTNAAPVANAGANQSVSVGANVTLNGTGSSDPDNHMPLSYGWTQTGGPAVTLSSNTAAQPSFTAPGSPAVLTFTLTVTDAQGLADATPDVVVITVSDIAITGLSADNDSPTRLTDVASFTATITAGSNVVYTWNFGDGSSTSTGATQSHIYAATGSYTAIVTATNAAGSLSTTTLVTVTNAAPIANAGPDQSVSVNASVTLNGNASADPDGHTPLTYAWTQTGGSAVTLSGASTSTPSFVAPAIPTVLTFALVVTDAQGLADATPDQVVITVGDVVISGLAAQSSSPTRLTDATLFTASVTAGSNVVFTWDFGDGSAAGSGATAAHTYAITGNYTAAVTATNDLGSVSTTTVVLVTNAAPSANAGANQAASVGASVTLAGSGSDPDNHLPLSYFWQQTGGPAVTLSNANMSSTSFTAPALPTVLTFTLHVTDSTGLADATPDEVVVTVNDIPISGLNAQNSSPTSLGTATSFTASIGAGANVAFTWNFGDGSPTVTGASVAHTYAAVGSYTAIVTATNGSGSTSTTTPVNVTNLAPVAGAGSDQNVSVGSSVTLSSTSFDPDSHTPLSYLWAQTGGPAVVLSNPTASQTSFTAPATPTVLTFTLSVTDSTGLAAATLDEVVITVLDVPLSGLSDINDSPTQLGSGTRLTASVSAGTNVTYTWDFGDGSPAANGATHTHTYAVVGTYTATVTATNSQGQTSTTTTVTIVDVPISNLSAVNSSPTRLTDATSFTASLSAGTNVAYEWNFGDGSATVNGATTSHVYATTGNFMAVVTATNGAGSVSASTLVTITNLPPVANAGNDQSVSILGNVNLIGVGSSDPDNHTPLTYAWQQTGGPAVTLSNPFDATPTFTAPGAPAVLTFTLVVTDAQGLASVLADEVVINVIDIGISGLSADNSSPTRLTAPTYFTASVISGSGVTYTWSFGDGSPMATGAFASHVYTATGNFVVVLTASNLNGSVSASTVADIVNLAPVANAGSDVLGIVNAQVSLGGGASVDPDGHTPLTYLWQQVGGPAVTLSSPTAITPTFTAPGVPTVLTFTLTVTDAQGLADATPDVVVVTVLDVPIAGLIAQSSSPTTLGQPTLLTASVSAGSNVVYAWNFGDGSPIGFGSQLSHVYPSASLFTATVIASNASNSPVGQVLVTIVNLPPVANAGADVTGGVGSLISLNGSASSDPDGHLPLVYAWHQTGGPAVTLSNAAVVAPSFTAPNAAGVLTFSLIVTDARGLADPTPDVVVVTVSDVPIAGLAAQSSSPTTLGKSTAFTASVTSGSEVVFTWNFGDGSPTVTGARVSHVYASAGSFVATVVASNSLGQTSATTNVSVVNQAPVANAGADQTVSVNGTVQLNGLASADADGHTPLSYRWVQTGGPTAQLSNATSGTPSFVAPGVPAVLTFTLSVTDARGLAAATLDGVVIRVVDIGISGLLATNDGPTTLGQATTFTATANTGSNVVFTWNYGDGTAARASVTRGTVSGAHTYAAVGTYTAVVTATNAQGSVTAQTIVTVDKPTQNPEPVDFVVYLPMLAR